MSQKYEKLKTLLTELFQLDQPDLDFGLYRIMHARSVEVTQFLDNDLLPQVKAVFKQYKDADKADLERNLSELIAGVEAAGMNPDDSPKITDIKTRLETAVDFAALESEVYDHLYRFFKRYYSEGDFLAKRVYKPGVYAIPYEGEEVAFHWANKDQYYIKTCEYLRDYAFRLRPEDEKNPMRVHFRLVDGTEGEHANVKASYGKDHVFILAGLGEAGHDFITEKNDGTQNPELFISFNYRPSTLTDWPAEVRGGTRRPPSQKELIDLAVKRILELNDLSPWIAELGTPHVMASGELANYCRLEAHLRRYTARNTFDFFIHKNLDTFLRRELDFYIKNEIMYLDDVENESILRVERYLSKIKVIRMIAGKIIDFLVQIEEFQKKLWLKKKFIVETHYCITVGCIPEEFYPEIAANEAQRMEWVALNSIDQINGDLITPGYSNKLSPEFLSAYPTLVVDTRYFDNDFTDRILESVSNMEDQIDGILFHSENFQALSMMEARFREGINCVYIDPPYNTAASAILYKNDYKDSSWLSLMADRLHSSRTLMSTSGILCCAIDDEEVSRLRMILQNLFPRELGTVVVRSNPAGRKSRGQLSPSHEFALFFGNEDASPGPIPKTERELARYPFQDDVGRYAWNNLIRHGSGDRREDVPTMFFPIYVSIDNQLRVPKLRWIPDERRYEVLEKPRNDEIEVLPIRRNGDEIIEKRWHHGLETIRNNLSQYRVRRNGDRIDIDFIIRMDTAATPRTWWDDSRFASSNRGSKTAKDFFGRKPFDYPKAVGLVEDCLRVCGLETDLTALDHFAGSGTTGHAVISLNREDGGRRKFILVEMADYFDTVLLPRLKKVIFTPEWKDGKPARHAKPEEAARSPRIVKVLRLESYEDVLNNLKIHRSKTQQSFLDSLEAQSPDGFREQYVLRYMLDVETRGSQSLLNTQAFVDPTAYKLKVKQPGSDESREVNVDLIETFNWLVGLNILQISAPQSFTPSFKRDKERRLCLEGRLRQEASGTYWFRTVMGTTPDGRRAIVIWRKLAGDPEKENLVLDEWFTICHLDKGSEFDVVWVNGGNNLENLKRPNDLWTVRLIEEDFHRLMFDKGRQ